MTAFSATTKVQNIYDIALTTGGTVNITNGVITPSAYPFFPSPEEYCTVYRITGTQTLASNFIIAMTGSPTENSTIEFHWKAVATPGAFNVQILGATIPNDYVGKNFILKMTFSGAGWAIDHFSPDFSLTGVLPGDRLTDLSVGTAKLTNSGVTYAKVQNATAYSVPARVSGTSGVLADLAMAANSIIARVAGNIVNLVVSTNGHVLKMSGGALGFGQLGFSELSGSIANAQIPDNEITVSKIQSNGLLASAYVAVPTTAVSTEETTFSYTLPANTVSADGKALKIFAAGLTAANSNAKTIRVKIGGVTVMSNAVVTAPNGEDWLGEVKVVRSSSSAGVAMSNIVFDASHDGVQVSTPAIDWTVSNAIVVTLQNGSASAGDITQSMVIVELLK